MKKINWFLEILIITILLLNIFLPMGYANSEVLDNVLNYESYNKLEQEENIIEQNHVNECNEVRVDENIVENQQNDKQKEVNKEEIQEDNKNSIIEENKIKLFDNTQTLGIQYRAHVQNIGWQNYVQNEQTAGTEGHSLRLEALNINLINASQNLKIRYQVHIQNIGWQDWKRNGEMAGTEGRSLRLEALRITLEDSNDYSIMYRVHVQDIGWQDWKSDWEISGTTGRSLRLEAIQIKIVPKIKKGRIYLDSPAKESVQYETSNIYVQGWKMANVSDTSIKAYIDNKEINSSSINYYNRLDVLNEIVDCGNASQNPNAGFRFSIPVENLSNGKHIIKVALYYNNELLTTIESNFYLDKSIHIQYRSHVQNIGWQENVIDGQISGTTGKSYRIEAMNISLINVPSNAKIIYRTHVQNIGWQIWKTNGEMTGTSGRSLRIEAIEIKLENMDDYTVEYQVHIQDRGWSDWYIDGETAGTVGQSKRIEAIRIRLVKKYKRQYNGIDVSQFNGSISWGKVKQAGIDFAFIRVGFRGYGQAGNFREDANFRANIQAAKQAGIPVGVYFITQSITPAEAIEEANWVLDKVRGYGLEYPIAIDIEAPGLEKPTDIPRTQKLDINTRTYLAKLFCQTIQNSGYTPIIYTNVDWATNKLNMSQLSEYDTWIASYRNGNPGYNGKYSIWQYTSQGSILGILGNVDLNYSYKKY